MQKNLECVFNCSLIRDWYNLSYLHNRWVTLVDEFVIWKFQSSKTIYHIMWNDKIWQKWRLWRKCTTYFDYYAPCYSEQHVWGKNSCIFAWSQFRIYQHLPVCYSHDNLKLFVFEQHSWFWFTLFTLTASTLTISTLLHHKDSTDQHYQNTLSLTWHTLLIWKTITNWPLVIAASLCENCTCTGTFDLVNQAWLPNQN